MPFRTLLTSSTLCSARGSVSPLHLLTFQLVTGRVTGRRPASRAKPKIDKGNVSVTVRNFKHPAQVVLFYGTQGTGKTTLMCELLRKENARIFVYDHKHEICTKLGVTCCYHPEEFAEAVNRGGVVCFDPCIHFAADKEAGFLFFADFIYQISLAGALRGRKIIVADELQRVADPERAIAPEIVLLTDDGRSLEIDFWGAAQGANRVHNWLRGQATEVYCFRQTNENSVKIICKDHGFNPDQIRAQHPGEWVWRDNTGSTRSGGGSFVTKGKRGARPAPARPSVEKRSGSPGDKCADGASSQGEPLPEVRGSQPA